MLTTKNVSKTFEKLSDNEDYALSNVTSKFIPGTISLITGPSGSGKTAFLHVLSGLEEPTSGEVFLNGEPLQNIMKSKRYYHVFGFLSKAPLVFSEMTVFENVFESTDMKNLTKVEKTDFVNKAITRLGLNELAHVRVKYLSSSQKQRVSLARIIASDVKVILADKPVANVDKNTARLFLKVFRELADQDKIIVIVSDNQIFNTCADQVLRFDNGKIHEENVLHNRPERVTNIEVNSKLGFHTLFIQSLHMLRTNIMKTIIILLLLSFSAGAFIAANNLTLNASPQIKANVRTENNENAIIVERTDGDVFKEADKKAIKNIFGDKVQYEPIASIYGSPSLEAVKVNASFRANALPQNHRYSRIDNAKQTEILENGLQYKNTNKSVKTGIFLSRSDAESILKFYKMDVTEESMEALLTKKITQQYAYELAIGTSSVSKQELDILGILNERYNGSLMSAKTFDDFYAGKQIPALKYNIVTKSPEEAESLRNKAFDESKIDSSKYVLHTIYDLENPDKNIVNVVASVINFIALLTLGASGVLVFLLLSSSTKKFAKEFSILKLQGVGRCGHFLIYAIVITFFATVATLIGFALSYELSNLTNYIFSIFIESVAPSKIEYQPVIIAFFIILLLTAVAAANPLYKALKFNIKNTIWK